MLVDTCARAGDARAFYSDAGLLPRVLQQVYLAETPGRLSLHMLGGSTEFELVLLSLAGFCAIGLAVGWRARWMAALSLAFAISIQSRNGLVETGVDGMILAMLTWSIFLPLDHFAPCASRVPTREHSIASAASFALIVQFSLIYLLNGLAKSGDAWRKSWSAVHYALHIDSYATTWGTVLRAYPEATRFLTGCVVAIEFAIPIALVALEISLIFSRSIRVQGVREAFREWAVVIMATFHCASGLILALGSFPWFAALFWVSLLPKKTWKRSPFRWLSRILTTNAPRPDRSEGCARRLCTWAVSTLLLLSVFGSTAATLRPNLLSLVDHSPLGKPIRLLKFDQNWGLFAPEPAKRDGFFSVVGTSNRGEKSELLRGGPLFERPSDVPGSYPNFRWRKLFQNLPNPENRAVRARLLHSFCQRERSKGLAHTELFSVFRNTLPSGGHGDFTRTSLATLPCRSRKANASVVGAGSVHSP